MGTLACVVCACHICILGMIDVVHLLSNPKVLEVLLDVRESYCRANPSPFFSTAQKYHEAHGPGVLEVPFARPELLIIDHHLSVRYRPDTLLAADEWEVSYTPTTQCVVKLQVHGECEKERIVVMDRNEVPQTNKWVSKVYVALAKIQPFGGTMHAKVFRHMIVARVYCVEKWLWW